MPDEPSIPWAGLFPELRRFGDRTAAAAALKDAKNRVARDVRRQLMLVGITLCAGVGMAFIIILLKSRFGWDVSWTGGFTGVVCSAVAAIAANWLFRVPVQRDLRRQLVERNVPVCVPCGYDLTGNISGRCPECGAASGA